MSNFSFAIVSDVHIFASGGVPTNFPKVISQLASLSPRFVVVSGDATSGNPDDGASRDKVALWWRAFRGALAATDRRGHSGDRDRRQPRLLHPGAARWLSGGLGQR
jgi:3',5'-cyclic AMP phosphodiesterase CpdA